LAYCAAFVALGLSHASLGPTLVSLAAQVGVGLVQISYGLSARSAGYLLGSVLGGRLYDAVKGHPLIAAMLALIAIGLAALPLAPGLWLLVVVLFGLGVAEGALDVGVNTLVVWVHRRNVSPYMNALHFFFGLGAFLSPIIVAQAVRLGGGMRAAYWVLAALMLPVASVVARVPSPSAVEQTGDASPEPGIEVRARGNDALLLFLLPLFFFLLVGVEGSFGNWIATYAQAMGLGDASTAAYLTSAFWGALTLGRLLSVPLAVRLAPRQVLAIDLAGCLLSVGVLLIWPGVRIATWVGTFGAGLCMASAFPTTLSLAERHLRITGAVTSLFFVGGSLGGMVLPWIIGQLFERIGPSVTIGAMATALTLCITAFGAIVVRTRARGGKVRYG
jgi:FHS family Na+ dependent glucose MFS transporter 1